jgi:hypothetical protein
MTQLTSHGRVFPDIAVRSPRVTINSIPGILTEIFYDASL